MENRRTLRRVVVALVLLVAFLSQGTWALAGTTGGLSGQVTDDKGAPVAGATVKVSSPSQTASVTTDNGGHYGFLTLAPDTYVVTATKDGYSPASYPGVTVFADQNLALAVTLPHAGLKNIANVTARSANSLVKAGTTVDVYQVNSATAAQMATGGGGNNLDSAYSVLASTPGVTSLPGNFGFGQLFFIHGSSYNQIGYEFDGVPVNRSFDNYNANSLSNLGTSATEVYTGGGPAGATSPTLGGYVNQVIKTGTYPGYIQGGGGIGNPAFYHQAQVEAGGATPDRNFSYYVGIRGSNMIPNQLDSQNGGDLNPDGNNQFGQQGSSWNTLLIPAELFLGTSSRGPWSDCVNGGATAPANGSFLSPVVSGLYGAAKINACNAYAPLAGTNTIALRGNDLSDRESVLNFHIGIPHKYDSGKDDVQILFDNFFYQTQAWDNLSTFGGLPFFKNIFESAGTNPDGTGNYNTLLGNVFGEPPGTNLLGPAGMPGYAGFCDYFNLYALFGDSNRCASTGFSPQPWFDGQQIVNAHFGQSALGSPHIVAPYFFPSSPTDRAFGSGISPYAVSDTNNNGSIVKLQYTKNIGSNAYVRIFGYSFYSDWLQTDPNASVTPFFVGGATSGDYELNTHTRGLYLQAADQINSQNLVTLTGNYTTATVLRMNNNQYHFTASGSPIATLANGSGQCVAAYNNTQSGGLIDPGYAAGLKAGSPVSCVSALAGAPVAAVQAGACPAGAAAAFACLPSVPGASWSLTQNLEPDANINTVGPILYSGALQDEFRPSDRWDINAGIRYESYGYNLGNVASPSQAFWFGQINTTACVAPNGLTQAPQTDLDGNAPRYGLTPSGYVGFITTAPGGTCPFDPVLQQQLYHPGQHGIPEISLGGSGTVTNTTFSPRVGFTYTMSPDGVLRFSYGRYTQPTPTAYEQVLTYPDGYQMATNLYNSQYYNIGLSSVEHNNPIQFSNNFDASWEQHLKNTELSFKVSPFYRLTSNQSVNVSLPGGLSGAFNSGTQESKGVELAVNYGDPSRNGFSGQMSYTYTSSQLKYALINGGNIVKTMLSSLQPFLGLEGVNGGSPCYVDHIAASGALSGAGVKNCSASSTFTVGGKKVVVKPTDYIYNPYYGYNITQSQLNSEFPLTGYYPTYANFFPYALQTGDASTIISPNVFSGWVSWKKNKFQATLTGNLWEGTQYGAPTEIAGTNPTSCTANQGLVGIVPGSQNADYQTCGSSIAIPNPFTGQFDNIGQYRNPWEFNLGAQLGYDFTPRVHGTILLANILNACFGGSAEPWTAAYAPNSVICAYAPNSTYIGATPGAGYFYGNSGHSAANGSGTYPKLFDQAYAPSTNQISAPFQMYFSVNVKL